MSNPRSSVLVSIKRKRGEPNKWHFVCATELSNRRRSVVFARGEVNSKDGTFTVRRSIQALCPRDGEGPEIAILRILGEPFEGGKVRHLCDRPQVVAINEVTGPLPVGEIRHTTVTPLLRIAVDALREHPHSDSSSVLMHRLSTLVNELEETCDEYQLALTELHTLTAGL